MSTPLTLSAGMVREHLSELTDGWFSHHNLPPVDLTAYAPYVEQVRLSAEQAGELPWFVLALQHLLAHPEIEVAEYGDDSYGYSDAQMHQILHFVLKQLGAAADPRAAQGVELVEMSDDEWSAVRDALEARQ